MKHSDRRPVPRRLANVRYRDEPAPPYPVEPPPQVIYQYVEVPVEVPVPVAPPPVRRPRWPWYLGAAVVSPLVIAIAWVTVSNPGLVAAVILMTTLIVCGLTQSVRTPSK